MGKFETVSIKPSTKDQLKLLKKNTEKSYDELISEMITKYDGMKVDDVTSIVVDNRAVTLNYVEIGESENCKSFDVTYSMLKTDPIGTIYIANEKPNRTGEYLNGICEIVHRRGNDVIVTVKDVHYKKGSFDMNYNVFHFNIF